MESELTANRSVLFVDQTAQLGGAELCLNDIVTIREHREDRVFLFQEGPLAEMLREAGVAVETDSRCGAVLAVRRETSLFGKLTSSRTVGRMARQVARAAGEVDVIYANTPKALVVAALAGKFVRKPVVYHLHDILSTDHFSKSSLALLVFMGKHFVSHTIANSQSSANAYVAAGGNRDRITVIHNGIDEAPFAEAITSSEEHRSAIRATIGAGENLVVALFGRFSPCKGQHVAIEMLHSLPKAHLMLVGDALFGETDYVDRLHRMAACDALRGRVHFMGFRSDVPAVMQAADVVVHCSTAPEPFGRVIVEAMLSRRPVIATRAGGAMEIVRERETGLLVTPESCEALSEAVTYLTAGQRDLTSMLDRAQSEARHRFDLRDRVTDVTRVINRTTLHRVAEPIGGAETQPGFTDSL